MNKQIALFVAISLAFTGCASDPSKMQAAQVSPTIYRGLDCDQIAQEMQRVVRRANQLEVSLKKKADDDSAQMAIGLILFFPVLFALEGGDGPDAAEYMHLKGEKDALEQVALQKKCASVPTIVEVNPSDPGNPVKPNAAGAPVRSKEDRLTELKALYDKELISKEIYEERQRAIAAE